MFGWVLDTTLLFTMNHVKGIALGEAVWRYPVLYNNCGDNHEKEMQRNCWNTVRG